MLKLIKSLVLIISILISQTALSETINLAKPGIKDTCPVCGMFVAKYPEWIATVVYKDQHSHHFDGAKDLFKYLHDLAKWAPGHKQENIINIGVTDYYSLNVIDARQAYFVIGSDVLGPMGHELIPLETVEDAEEFLTDHKGSKILRFDQVAADIPQKLDNGLFE